MILGNTSQDRLSVEELPLEVVMAMTTAENPLSGFLVQGTTGSLIRRKANKLPHTFVVPVTGYADGFLALAAFRPCVPYAVVVFYTDIRKNRPGEPRSILRGCHDKIGLLKRILVKLKDIGRLK
jgi:hypothetical protein